MVVLQKNKKAFVDYDIIEKFEAGISLEGWEVKSISNHQVGLSNAFVVEKEGEMFLKNAHVPSWKFGETKSKDQEYKDRKLLLKKKEIKKLAEIIDRPGFSVVPISLYRNDKRLIKLEIGIGKGRKKFDKRQKLKERDIKRRIDSDRKNYNF